MVNKLRQLIRNYFAFSRVQTNGFLVLVPLMIIILFLPGIYVKVFSKEYNPYEEDVRIMDSLMAVWNEVVVMEAEKREPVNDIPVELRSFDPNHAKIAELQSLGVPAFLARRIDNYRNKGGQFRIKSDLARIYDFPDSLFNQLEPHIELPDRVEKKKVVPDKPGRRSDSVVRRSWKTDKMAKKTVVKLWIDLSQADTTELMKLRGIGPSFSRRIVKYRSLLGGFVAKEQLKEVYGLSDSLYMAIQDQVYVGLADSLATVNLNVADYSTLRKHPYISYKVAREIVKSRSKIGKFRSPWDLLVVQGLDSAGISRLSPYITY